MKKFFALSLALVMSIGLVACGTSQKKEEEKKPEQKEQKEEKKPEGQKPEAEKKTEQASAKKWKAGVCIYKFDDTFMTSVRNQMQKRAEELGSKLDIQDSQNKQPEQNNQVDTFVTQGVDGLILNPVDRVAAQPLLDKAKESKIPVVFINREPEKGVMDQYDKAWYVGAKAEQSGTLSGQIIADYFKAHPEADKNKDGVIQYVMLQGEPGHQDATLRTEYSLKALEEAGFKVEKLAADTAMWDTAKGTDLMNTWITRFGIDKIEAVLSNNDDMALGAIAALNSKGYNQGEKDKFIPVVGVDATTKALNSMAKGGLLGTVLNDGVNQGTAAVNILNAAINGQEINEKNVGYKVDGRYVWIEYVKVTQDNYKDFMAK